MELYGDLTNCFGPLEQKYHAEILKLRYVNWYVEGDLFPVNMILDEITD